LCLRGLNFSRLIFFACLVCGFKDARRLIGDAERDAGARAEFRQADDRRRVEAQARGPDLRADAELADAFGAQRGGAASRIQTPVDLTDDIDPFVDLENSRQTVEQKIVLRKSFERRGHDPESQIAENIDARRFSRHPAEAFLEQDLAEDIDLVRADAFRLIGVRHLKTEFQSDRRQIARFVAQLDLRGDDKIVEIVGRVAVKTQGDRRRRDLRIDRQIILQCAFDLELDVARKAGPDADVADARQIAFQARERKFDVLQKIDAGRDLDRALRRNIDVFREQRALLGESRDARQKNCRKNQKQTRHWF
jgi:hypothetical protein